jgi:hypothetical protein
MFARLLAPLLLVLTVARAAYPDFSGTKPNGGPRGGEVKVTLTGTRLADFEDLLFYTPGFQVKGVQSVAAGKVELTLAIGPEVPLGNHLVRIRTKSGLSHARQFFVSPFPNLEEKEPNDDLARAQPVELGRTLEGVVLAEDVDYYKVAMRKGQRLSVEVDGLRLGYEVFDPYVAILDKDRFEKAFSDDTILHRQDGYCSFVAEYDGDYYVMVRESSYRGSARSFYRLHIGSFPRPDVVFPAGGKLGSKLPVSFVSARESFTEEVALPAEPRADFQLYARTQASAPSGNVFRLSPVDNFLEAEPNDERETANVVPPADAYALNGIIGKPGDIDYYKLTLKKGQVLEGQCLAQTLGSPLDPTIRIATPAGGDLISNDDGGGMRRLDSRFRVTVPADGVYTLRVRDHLERGAANFVYRVELTASAPSLTFASPDYTVNDTNYRQFIAVPRGGRMALLQNFTRSGVGGDYRFEAPGLPAGVKLLADAAPKDLPNVPLVFEAAADAPLGQAVVPLRLQPLDPKQTVVGRMRQVYDIVRNGNVIYYQGVEDRLPVAVVEAAPYALEIAVPRVPVVQNGVLSLPVIAQRKPGFTGPIRVFMVWTPPGITSLGEQTIPEGQDRCTFELSASAGVTPADWNFVVMGEADAGNGRVYNASPFAKVTTAPAFVAANAIPLAAIEQGKEAVLVTNLEVLRPFEGEAVARLVGVPDTIAIAPVKVTKDSKEMRFTVRTTAESPLGKKDNLFVQVDVPLNGATTTHRVALGSSLRIDAPRKGSPAPAAPPVAASAKPVAAAAPAAPAALSRLEQLRQKTDVPKN